MSFLSNAQAAVDAVLSGDGPAVSADYVSVDGVEATVNAILERGPNLGTYDLGLANLATLHVSINSITEPSPHDVFWIDEICWEVQSAAICAGGLWKIPVASVKRVRG